MTPLPFQITHFFRTEVAYAQPWTRLQPINNPHVTMETRTHFTETVTWSQCVTVTNTGWNTDTVTLGR